MEECDTVCRGDHGIEWQSLVTPDLRWYRAASVGNIVKCGIRLRKAKQPEASAHKKQADPSLREARNWKERGN